MCIACLRVTCGEAQAVLLCRAPALASDCFLKPRPECTITERHARCALSCPYSSFCGLNHDGGSLCGSQAQPALLCGLPKCGISLIIDVGPSLTMLRLVLLALCVATRAAVGGDPLIPIVSDAEVYRSVDAAGNIAVLVPNTAVAGAPLQPAAPPVAQAEQCAAACRQRSGDCRWFTFCSTQVSPPTTLRTAIIPPQTPDLQALRCCHHCSTTVRTLLTLAARHHPPQLLLTAWCRHMLTAAAAACRGDAPMGPHRPWPSKSAACWPATARCSRRCWPGGWA